MNRRPPERPVWDALSNLQRHHSVGGDRARRFAPEIGPFAAARNDSPESLRALAELVPESGSLLLLQAGEILLPPGTAAVTRAPAVQMIGDRFASAPLPRAPAVAPGQRLVRLTERDAHAMLELASLTQPGPFAARTGTLGEFWGVMDGDTLVAMAGERMRHEGFTELSGVCTHPDARGQGLARALSAWVSARIVARGQLPHLHAYASNTAAVELYRSLGFTLCREMDVATIARAAQ